MKQFLIILAIASICACNQRGHKNPVADSLGVKAIDTFRRNDTMYYERMQNKSFGAQDGPFDSAQDRSLNKAQGDTAYYERLQQKTTKDTSKNQ